MVGRKQYKGKPSLCRGIGFRVSGLGFRVQSLGFRVRV